MFSDIYFSDSHVYVDKFECQKLNFELNKSKVAVPHFWVLPIKTTSSGEAFEHQEDTN